MAFLALGRRVCHGAAMVAAAVVAALLVGGLIGALSRRVRPERNPLHRGVDSDRVDVQAGWRNMQAGP